MHMHMNDHTIDHDAIDELKTVWACPHMLDASSIGVVRSQPTGRGHRFNDVSIMCLRVEAAFRVYTIKVQATPDSPRVLDRAMRAFLGEMHELVDEIVATPSATPKRMVEHAIDALCTHLVVCFGVFASDVQAMQRHLYCRHAHDCDEEMTTFDECGLYPIDYRETDLDEHTLTLYRGDGCVWGSAMYDVMREWIRHTLSVHDNLHHELSFGDTTSVAIDAFHGKWTDFEDRFYSDRHYDAAIDVANVITGVKE